MPVSWLWPQCLARAASMRRGHTCCTLPLSFLGSFSLHAVLTRGARSCARRSFSLSDGSQRGGWQHLDRALSGLSKRADMPHPSTSHVCGTGACQESARSAHTRRDPFGGHGQRRPSDADLHGVQCVLWQPRAPPASAVSVSPRQGPSGSNPIGKGLPWWQGRASQLGEEAVQGGLLRCDRRVRHGRARLYEQRLHNGLWREQDWPILGGSRQGRLGA